mmetsp:Transcript_27461/g.51437  ORF Transcript_27461/g.51437 Transcript_27461/m.51437 type:complete len:229 (-) Transcript_27461:109-795(-)
MTPSAATELLRSQSRELERLLYGLPPPTISPTIRHLAEQRSAAAAATRTAASATASTAASARAHTKRHIFLALRPRFFIDATKIVAHLHLGLQQLVVHGRFLFLHALLLQEEVCRFVMEDMAVDRPGVRLVLLGIQDVRVPGIVHLLRRHWLHAGARKDQVLAVLLRQVCRFGGRVAVLLHQNGHHSIHVQRVDLLGSGIEPAHLLRLRWAAGVLARNRRARQRSLVA